MINEFCRQPSNLDLYYAIIRAKLVFVMLVAVSMAIVINFAGNKVHVLKLLIPFCMSVDQKQHGNGLLSQEIVIKLGIRFAIKAFIAFRVPCIDCNFSRASKSQ